MVTCVMTSSCFSTDFLGPVKKPSSGRVRSPSQPWRVTVAPREIRIGGRSAEGMALAMFPPIVPVLRTCEAAHSMAATQVRNTGDIGGNIPNAMPNEDHPPILIYL